MPPVGFEEPRRSPRGVFLSRVYLVFGQVEGNGQPSWPPAVQLEVASGTPLVEVAITDRTATGIHYRARPLIEADRFVVWITAPP